jgi:hypothetical protein
MPDLLTSIRTELAARLKTSREVVEESDRLRAALRALDAIADDGCASWSPDRGRTGRPLGRQVTRRTAPGAATLPPAVAASTTKAPADRMRRRRVPRS